MGTVSHTALAVVALALLSPVADAKSRLAGKRLSHPNGYTIVVPTGWDPYVGEKAMGGDFRLFTPNRGDGMCVFTSSPGLGLNMTEADLKDILATADLGGETFTKYFLGGEMSDIVYTQTGPQPDHPGGWPVQRAELTYSDGGPAANGGTPSVAWAYMTFRRDTLFIGYCGVDAGVADAMRNDVKALIDAIEFNP